MQTSIIEVFTNACNWNNSAEAKLDINYHDIRKAVLKSKHFMHSLIHAIS